eukprot:6095053-Pleurochrysis_carterae.AAC.3
MDIGDCATGRVYFEIAISLYTGFVHGLYFCTFWLYTASIFVHVYNMHLYTQRSPGTRCWPIARRVTGRVAFRCTSASASSHQRSRQRWRRRRREGKARWCHSEIKRRLLQSG